MRYFLFVLLFTLFHFNVFNYDLYLSTASAAGEMRAADEAGETEEEEAAKYAGEKGFRKGKVTPQSLEVYLDGKLLGKVTEEKLAKLQEKHISTPRGPKVGWRVVDALAGEGVKDAQTVEFKDAGGKKLYLNWSDLVRQKEDVVLTYNFRGELILETNVKDRVQAVSGKDKEAEEKVRKEMHKNRQKSLIFLRNVNRIDIGTK